ncbi:MAG: hypothetical protein HYS81_01910 [Candidatus Aenigmatarchaeota archaeon]|nr:MAG: hypothetical protein HYS81_01910 [Candidatus Aenigmarchaeota archaeon]
MKKLKFYENQESHLRITEGSKSNMTFVLRLGTQEESHLTYGYMRLVGNQLFFDIAPQVSGNVFLQARQDTKDGDTIDVYGVVVSPAGTDIIWKDKNWHHQPSNVGSLYDTQFKDGAMKVQICIGSGLPLKDTLTHFQTTFVV